MIAELTQRLEDNVTALLHDAVCAFPPPTAPFVPIYAPPERRPFGDYLLMHGYATPRQIGMALREQQQRARQGTHWPLGDILVAHEIVHPQVLTAMLLVQLLDRVAAAPASAPRLLGEQLIVSDLITPRQLAAALQQQSWLRQHGSWIRLGELLTQQGLVDGSVLAATLKRL
jgi:hypothetical protein